MELGAIIAAFAAVFVAELPDKTMVATIVLSSRFQRPLPVWVGAFSALATQMAIAVAAGRLLGLLPDRIVSAAVAVLFATGAVLLWRSAGAAPDDAGSAAPTVSAAPWWRISLTVYGIVFLAEWGDLTQLTTAGLAADRDALSVFLGAVAAMAAVAGIGVIAGRTLLRVLPEHLLRRIAAGVFAALAIVAAVGAIRG